MKIIDHVQRMTEKQIVENRSMGVMSHIFLPSINYASGDKTVNSKLPLNYLYSLVDVNHENKFLMFITCDE